MTHGEHLLQLHDAFVGAKHNGGTLWLEIPVANLGLRVCAFLPNPAAARLLAGELLAVAAQAEGARQCAPS